MSHRIARRSRNAGLCSPLHPKFDQSTNVSFLLRPDLLSYFESFIARHEQFHSGLEIFTQRLVQTCCSESHNVRSSLAGPRETLCYVLYFFYLRLFTLLSFFFKNPIEFDFCARFAANRREKCPIHVPVWSILSATYRRILKLYFCTSTVSHESSVKRENREQRGRAGSGKTDLMHRDRANLNEKLVSP